MSLSETLRLRDEAANRPQGCTMWHMSRRHQIATDQTARHPMLKRPCKVGHALGCCAAHFRSPLGRSIFIGAAYSHSRTGEENVAYVSRQPKGEILNSGSSIFGSHSRTTKILLHKCSCPNDDRRPIDSLREDDRFADDGERI
jgi:hypothetical protein